MLRILVLLLVLLNGAYLAWSQGWLLGWGYGPVQQREPQRVEQQIRPEALELLPLDKVQAPAPAAPAAPAESAVPEEPASGR